MASLHPRKVKQQATFLALIAFISLSTYLYIMHSPSFALARADSPATGQMAVALETIRNSRLAAGAAKKHKSHKNLHESQPLQLNAQQELAAVSSFLASLPQNVIPLTVDPSKPIDPQLVLDFDMRSHRAADEVREMVDDVWLRNPVFLYSKLYSPVSREVKSILAQLHLRPAPTIIDVDTRDDAEVLKPLLSRITSMPDLPLLLIGGRPVGTIEEIRELQKSGQLRQLVAAAGAVVDGAKKKKHRK